MDYNTQAAVLIEQVRENKRTAHRARRQVRSALGQLEELKQLCLRNGFGLVVDGVDLLAAQKEQAKND